MDSVREDIFPNPLALPQIFPANAARPSPLLHFPMFCDKCHPLCFTSTYAASAPDCIRTLCICPQIPPSDRANGTEAILVQRARVAFSVRYA